MLREVLDTGVVGGGGLFEVEEAVAEVVEEADVGGGGGVGEEGGYDVVGGGWRVAW